MVYWLIGRGMPKAGAAALMWRIKPAAPGALLRVAVGLAPLPVFLVFVTRGCDSSVDLTTPDAEWRYGPQGMGSIPVMVAVSTRTTPTTTMALG